MSVGSVCAYTAIALLFNSFVFSRVSFSLPHYSPRPFVSPLFGEQDILGHQSDCLEALGLGWVAGALLLAVAFRAAAFLPLSAPAPAAMLRKGVDDCFRVASDMFV